MSMPLSRVPHRYLDSPITANHNRHWRTRQCGVRQTGAAYISDMTQAAACRRVRDVREQYQVRSTQLSAISLPFSYSIQAVHIIDIDSEIRIVITAGARWALYCPSR